jgi:hypothetical protein
LLVRDNDLESLLGFVRDDKGVFKSYKPDCAVAKLLSLPIPRGAPATVVRKPEEVLPEAAFLLDRESSVPILKLQQAKTQ